MWSNRSILSCLASRSFCRAEKKQAGKGSSDGAVCLPSMPFQAIGYRIPIGAEEKTEKRWLGKFGGFDRLFIATSRSAGS